MYHAQGEHTPMKDTIRFPRTEGQHSKQAHCDLPAGSFEREFGKEGFFGPATHIIHPNNPMGWVEWHGPLRPRAYDLAKLDTAPDMPHTAPLVMHNAHLKLRLWRTQGSMPHLACNGDGDELLFVHAGSGDLFCDFGHLSFTEGDYILLPRATRWRVVCAEPSVFLMMEATNDSFVLPDKGMVGPHAIFDPAILESPSINDAFRTQQGPHRTEVHITRRGELSRVVFPFNPLDAIGWHGDNLVVKVNWRAIRPLMSHRYHLPPSAHTTFLTRRFVVCTFVPRLIETDPGALKVPFFHSNNDYDEIIFYHAGNFFSRDNIHPGMMTVHPAGFPHGPHPKAFAAGTKATRTETDEVAVMIDTRDAVDISPTMDSVEWSGYVDSWKRTE
jgi:homogentisate 1,2-dioxygenase